MFSILFPVGPEADLNLLSLLCLQEVIRGKPHEILILCRENSAEISNLVHYDRIKVVNEDRTIKEFGPLLNYAAQQADPSSKVLWFSSPGMLYFNFPYERILKKLSEDPQDIFGFEIQELKNPQTKMKQSFPSWLCMCTSKEYFSSVDGFSEYLPVIGGDLLYCLEAANKGGKIQRVLNSHSVLRHYEVVDEEIEKVHSQLLIKRLPLIMSSRGLRGDIMEGWPGVTRRET